MSKVEILEIINFLPHRYPFLLVYSVVEVDHEEQSLLALKNVTMNEPFFQGHFPQQPVMPGVLIIESLAQAAGLYVSQAFQSRNDGEKMFYLTGIDKGRFKRVVVPGDQLALKVKLVKKRNDNFFKFDCQALVDDEIACTAEITAVQAQSND